MIQAPITELLDIMSTIPQFVSYRFLGTGSYFIQFLCSWLSKEHNNIYEVVHKVQDDLRKNPIPDWVDHENVSLMQTCEMRSCLQKHVRFTKPNDCQSRRYQDGYLPGQGTNETHYLYK